MSDKIFQDIRALWWLIMEHLNVTSLQPDDAISYQWYMSTLIQVMVWHKHWWMQTCCQLDLKEQTSVIFLKIKIGTFSPKKMHLYCLHYKMLAILFRLQCVNSLGPSDAIRCWRSWSTLGQVMACCLTAPSHYLNQCWLIISKVLWHSSEDIITRRFEDTNQ